MELKNRIGTYLVFLGAIFLFIFFASLYTPDKAYNFAAFLIGVLLVSLGWPMRSAKKAAPPPPPKPAPPPAAPKPAAPAPKKPGLLTTILKGPPKKAPAPPSPPPPPPPPPKKGLAAFFSAFTPKPKKK